MKVKDAKSNIFKSHFDKMEDQKILKISTRKNYLFALPFRVELKPHKLRLFDIYIFVVSVNQE